MILILSKNVYNHPFLLNSFCFIFTLKIIMICNVCILLFIPRIGRIGTCLYPFKLSKVLTFVNSNACKRLNVFKQFHPTIIPSYCNLTEDFHARLYRHYYFMKNLTLDKIWWLSLTKGK